jgi:transcriptional regulator with XRE-family HTH domain
MAEARSGGESKDAWADVARFIRAQRKVADISLRHLARLTNVSDSYLSQVERGMYQPSPEVLKSIADALGISTNALFSRLGWLDDQAGPGAAGAAPSVEEAIKRDPKLTPQQKKVLRDMYRTLVGTAG